MRKNSPRKQGIAIVEFALVMAVLLVPVVAGVWDVSKFIDINQVLTRAAREGVVLASRGTDPTSKVMEYAEAGDIIPAHLTVTVEYGADDPVLGQEVRVVLSYDFSGYTIFPWENVMPNGLNTVATAKME